MRCVWVGAMGRYACGGAAGRAEVLLCCVRADGAPIGRCGAGWAAIGRRGAGWAAIGRRGAGWAAGTAVAVARGASLARAIDRVTWTGAMLTRVLITGLIGIPADGRADAAVRPRLGVRP